MTRVVAPEELRRSLRLHSQKRLARLKAERSVASLRAAPGYARRPGDFLSAWNGVVAEIRFAAPPDGFLSLRRPSAEAAVALARDLREAGASALSVAVERNFFGGDPAFIGAIRAALPDVPLLMRDEVIDSYQLDLARAEGADAVVVTSGPEEAGLRARAAELELFIFGEGPTPKPGQPWLKCDFPWSGEAVLLNGAGAETRLWADALMTHDDPAAAFKQRSAR